MQYNGLNTGFFDDRGVTRKAMRFKAKKAVRTSEFDNANRGSVKAKAMYAASRTAHDTAARA